MDACVAALAALDLVSDERFAEAYARARIDAGCGPVRIAKELRERGVAAETAARVLDGYAGEWGGRIEALRQKRFGPEPPADRKQRTRQARYLQYKGFTADQIRRLLSERE